MGHRLWLPAVAIHRLGIVEIAPSPHCCFRTANPCAQSVNGSPAEPVLSRSSRQRLGHLQSHFDRGWHVCQAVFPELQPAAACRRVERRDGAHEALPRLQSACSWLVMDDLCEGGSRIADLESGRVRDVHASTVYSLYRLNKYGERTHPCLTPFPIEKLSVSPYSVRTFASWFAYSDLITCTICSGTSGTLPLFHTPHMFAVVSFDHAPCFVH